MVGSLAYNPDEDVFIAQRPAAKRNKHVVETKSIRRELANRLWATPYWRIAAKLIRGTPKLRIVLCRGWGN